jgi:hypothetical protein
MPTRRARPTVVRPWLPLVGALLLVLGGPGGSDPLPAWADPPPKPPVAPAKPGKGGKPAPKAEPGVPDAALQERINAAIDKGAAWLRTQQKDSGWMAPVVQRGEPRYKIGTSALAGLALLASGDTRGTPALDKIMTVCRAEDESLGTTGGRTTYETGVLMMFTVEYYRSRAKEAPPKGGTREGRPPKNPCSLPPDVLAWLQQMVDWMVSKQQDNGGWGYPAHRPDLSNTQYAILGIRAARDCGANVPATTFEKALALALAWQAQDGPKARRLLPNADPSGSPYVIEAGDRERGWPYMTAPPPAYTGSMTTAGLALLAVSHDALLRPRHLERYDSAAQRVTEQAVQDGFAWLDKHWTVERNPGPSAPNWHYYYLYGLERAAALCGRSLVGLHDWYIEGARYLVDQQKPEGFWGTGTLGFDNEYEANTLLDTCWALLFLKRATRPMPPIEPPNVTPGG